MTRHQTDGTFQTRLENAEYMLSICLVYVGSELQPDHAPHLGKLIFESIGDKITRVFFTTSASFYTKIQKKH